MFKLYGLNSRLKNVFLISIAMIFFFASMANSQDVKSKAHEEDVKSKVSSEDIIKGLSKSKPKSKFEFQISGKKGGVKKLRRITVYREGTEGKVVKRTMLIFEDAAPAGVKLKIEFDVNSHVIRPESYGLLKEVAKALTSKQIKKATVLIKGHTDSDGDASKNIELSYRRALSVKNYLVTHFDIDPLRLKVAGYGEQCPFLPNTTPGNKQLNRRVEIELVEGT
jgi:outer membrane protein OmpA-like peptidoglycan-associated protein